MAVPVTRGDENGGRRRAFSKEPERASRRYKNGFIAPAEVMH